MARNPGAACASRSFGALATLVGGAWNSPLGQPRVAFGGHFIGGMTSVLLSSALA